MKTTNASVVKIISRRFEQLPEDKKKELTSAVANTIETYKKSIKKECKDDGNPH